MVGEGADQSLPGDTWLPVFSDVPDETLQKLAHGVSWWLQAIAKTYNGQEEKFLTLCERVLALGLCGRFRCR